MTAYVTAPPPHSHSSEQRSVVRRASSEAEAEAEGAQAAVIISLHILFPNFRGWANIRNGQNSQGCPFYSPVPVRQKCRESGQCRHCFAV